MKIFTKWLLKYCYSAPKIPNCCFDKCAPPHSCCSIPQAHRWGCLQTWDTLSINKTWPIPFPTCYLPLLKQAFALLYSYDFRAYVHYVRLLFESSVTLWNCSKMSIFFWVLDIYSLIFKVCNLLSKLHSTHSASRLNDLTFINLLSFHRKRFCLDTKHLSMIRQISATLEKHCKKGYEQREIEIIFKTPQRCK